MDFLTKPECQELASRIGFREDRPTTRINTVKHAASFVYERQLAYAASWHAAGAVATHLAEHLGRFTRAVLWAHHYPFWWDRSRDEHPPATWRRLIEWRAGAGETRSLRERPGHLFSPDESTELLVGLERVIDTQCEAVLFTRPFRDLIIFNDGDLIVIQSRHNLSALCDKLIRLGLRPL